MNSSDFCGSATINKCFTHPKCMRALVLLHLYMCMCGKEQSVVPHQINEHETLSMVLKMSCSLHKLAQYS